LATVKGSVGALRNRGEVKKKGDRTNPQHLDHKKTT